MFRRCVYIGDLVPIPDILLTNILCITRFSDWINYCKRQEYFQGYFMYLCKYAVWEKQQFHCEYSCVEDPYNFNMDPDLTLDLHMDPVREVCS